MLRLLDLAAAVGVKIVPMFWGVTFGWEVATGYPWGFWKGPDYDLLAEGRSALSRRRPNFARTPKSWAFISRTKSIPAPAPCARMISTCSSRPATATRPSAVNADPSHCWEGESWETRFLKVASRIYACHVKNFVVRPNFPLRMAEPGWQKRAMQFVDIPSGDLNMTRYVELLIHAGYPQRYCAVMKTKTAPLIVEAESAYRELDATSANGVAFVRDHLCFSDRGRLLRGRHGGVAPVPAPARENIPFAFGRLRPLCPHGKTP